MREDRQEWRRKHDVPRLPAYIPAGQATRAFPESRADLIELIQRAEAPPPSVPLGPHAGPTGARGRSVRPAGSGWSLSGIVVPPDYHDDLALTEGLTATLYDVVPSCLSDPVIEKLTRQSAPVAGAIDQKSINFYHVEAGVKIFRLYSRLDRRPHPDDGAWADFPTDRDPRTAIPGLEGSWALPTMGNAGGQSIAGAISTSTHGGDIRLPPLADAVAALHLIGGEGREYWIEPDPPKGVNYFLTDAGRLSAALPGVEIIRNDAIFNAALVSAGRMGVIYSMVLRVVRQFALTETRRHRTWEGDVRDLVARLDLNREPFSNRYTQIVLNPHARGDGRHSAWISTRDPFAIADGDETEGRHLRSGENAGSTEGLEPQWLTNLVCAQSPDAAAVLAPASAFLYGAGSALLLTPLGVLSGPIFTLADVLTAIAIADGGDSLGGLVNDALNAVAGAGRLSLDVERLVGLINEGFLGLGQGDVDRRDVSYAIMDGHNYVDRNCEDSADSLEVAFPAASPTLLTWVDQLFAAARDLTHRGLAFAGYASLRFTGPTRATIGIQRWEPTCIIEVAGLKQLDGAAAFLAQVESEAKALGATVHWGQRNELTLDEVERSYPGIEAWRDALARVSKNGANQTFSTSHTRERGLEVVQPRFQHFSVHPRSVCEGGDVTITWDASENPPDTTVELQLAHRGGVPGQTIRLGKSGTYSLPVPRGFSRVSATAVTPSPDGSSRARPAHTLGYDLRGYASGDRIVISGPAEIREIDGAERWAYEVYFDQYFGPHSVSPHLWAGEIHIRPGFPPVTVRRQGADDLVLSETGAQSGRLSSRQRILGSWLLFEDVLRHVPPELGIEIEVDCR